MMLTKEEEQTFIKKLEKKKMVFHPKLGEIPREKRKSLPYYFDPEYNDWIAPTESEHDAVAGIPNWRIKNPLTPEENQPNRKLIKSAKTWPEINPLTPEKDDS